MLLLPALAPLFLLFEIWQLAMSERYLGIKQIGRGTDPREIGPGETLAFLWTAGLGLYAVWTLLLLFFPVGRVHALCLMAVTAVGFSIRRNCGLAWVLVVLTFEGAVRVGFLFSLSAYAWRRL